MKYQIFREGKPFLKGMDVDEIRSRFNQMERSGKLRPTDIVAKGGKNGEDVSVADFLGLEPEKKTKKKGKKKGKKNGGGGNEPPRDFGHEAKLSGDFGHQGNLDGNINHGLKEGTRFPHDVQFGFAAKDSSFAKGWLIAGLVIAAMLGAGLLGWLFWSHSNPAPAPKPVVVKVTPPAPAPATKTTRVVKVVQPAEDLCPQGLAKCVTELMADDPSVNKSAATMVCTGVMGCSE